MDREVLMEPESSDRSSANSYGKLWHGSACEILWSRTLRSTPHFKELFATEVLFFVSFDRVKSLLGFVVGTKLNSKLFVIFKSKHRDYPSLLSNEQTVLALHRNSHHDHQGTASTWIDLLHGV